tara:strand:+ start:396 stop:959 length:564 start_codon:yes stop_codon:yes gene_type:complete
MKKLLIILLCLPLLFATCKKNDPAQVNPPNSPNLSCGSINTTINLTPLNTYNPIIGCEDNNYITYSLATGYTMNLFFYSECTSVNLAPDYTITIQLTSPNILQINTPYTFVANNNNLVIPTVMYEERNCGNSNVIYNNTDNNGTLTLTQLDTINNLVSGNFTGLIQELTLSPGTQFNFYCNFSNVPF